jgi:hypothetical protein
MQLSESWRRHIEPVIVGAAFEVLSTINMDLTKELILPRPTIMSRGIGNEKLPIRIPQLAWEFWEEIECLSRAAPTAP